MRNASISVRDLVEFVWREGGLGRTGEGSLPNRALRGTRGHQEVQRQRPPSYLPEVAMRHEFNDHDFQLTVLGRIDGIFGDQSPVVIEEIKTVTQGWDGNAKPLHRAQLRFYAAVYAEQNDLSEVGTQLTYYNLDTRQLEHFREREERSSLATFLSETLESFCQWQRGYWDWCAIRDRSISTLQFPFDSTRPGQGELMAGVEEVVKSGGRLFSEAATGLGKTMAILYPVIRSLATGGADRITFLTAKNTGKAAAVQSLELLREKGLRLRSLNLKSRTSTCVHDGQACDMESCPLAVDYYRNQKAAMEDALGHDHVDFECLSEIGDRHRVCPFELAMDVIPFVDLVICDYNYVFDQQKRLCGALRVESSKVVALVDECHNLVERGRELYSAALNSSELSQLKSEIGARSKGLRRCVSSLLGLFRKHKAPVVVPPREPEPVQQLLFSETEALVDFKPKRRVSSLSDGSVSEGIPDDVFDVLRRAVTDIEEWLTSGVDAPYRERLLDLYFQLLSFMKLKEHDPTLFRCYIDEQRNAVLRLFCVDSALLLRESMDEFSATICFSGTLSPLPIFRRLLGGDSSDKLLRFGSPFDSQRARVLLDARIDTRLKYRRANEPALVKRIMQTVTAEKGSYLVFFSSYDYLLNVLDTFREHCLEVGCRVSSDEPLAAGGTGQNTRPEQRFVVTGSLAGEGETEARAVKMECVWQVPGMGDDERARFVANISCSQFETVLTFAVLGGLFGESMDVSGGSIRGVIVVGVGYPMISRERNLVSAYFDAKSGDGFELAYQVPGMNRVVQAAGRLIRNESDRGTILLIDRRYADARYRDLLPPWWSTEYA